GVPCPCEEGGDHETEGATTFLVVAPFLSGCFNPRTREGCDFASSIGRSFVSRFRSTHPRGVRPCWPTSKPPYRSFRSTHPRGVRPQPRLPPRHHPTFRSTHPRGVRRSQPGRVAAAPGFDPRTREGCDAGGWCRRPRGACFDPRTREGCDVRWLATCA